MDAGPPCAPDRHPAIGDLPDRTRLSYGLDTNRNLVNDRLPGSRRNAFVGPDFKTLDLRLTYRVPAGGRQRELHLTADLMNTLNWVNFSAPNNVVVGTSLPPTFGTPQGALEGRQFQLGVRVNY